MISSYYTVVFPLYCVLFFIPASRTHFQIDISTENTILPSRLKIVQLNNEKRSGINESSLEIPEYWLYTISDREMGQKINLEDSNSVESSNFNASNPTRFIIHGWNDDANSLASILIRSSYLDRRDFNIFAIDWSHGVLKKSFIVARNDVLQTANYVTDSILFLKNEHNLNLDTSYLIGHNLGAHIAGLVGKRLKTETGPISAIIGLDPALPLYSVNNTESRLAKGDAKYILTIQTSGEQLGFHWPIGDAAFYPSWGRMQPGCYYDSSGRCSDALAAQYFAVSLMPKNEFLAKQCDGYENIRNEKCRGISDNGQLVEMGGDPLNIALKGVFYLPVDTKYPFGMGKFSDENN